MRKLLIAALLFAGLQAGTAYSSQIIKKSVNNICHPPNGTYYERTKRYTSYPTMEACIASGGRPPKR